MDDVFSCWVRKFKNDVESPRDLEIKARYSDAASPENRPLLLPDIIRREVSPEEDERSARNIRRSPKSLSEVNRIAFTLYSGAVKVKPISLKEYKKIEPKKYVELGKLQPNSNLTTESFKQKQRKVEKSKVYSDTLRSINMKAIDLQKHKTKCTSPQKTIKDLEETENTSTSSLDTVKLAAEVRRRDAEIQHSTGYTQCMADSRLEELESRHSEQQNQVESIRRFVESYLSK